MGTLGMGHKYGHWLCSMTFSMTLGTRKVRLGVQSTGPAVDPSSFLYSGYPSTGHLYDFAELLRTAEQAGFKVDRGEIRRASYRTPLSSPLAHLDQWWRGLESLYVELSVSAGEGGGDT